MCNHVPTPLSCLPTKMVHVKLKLMKPKLKISTDDMSNINMISTLRVVRSQTVDTFGDHYYKCDEHDNDQQILVQNGNTSGTIWFLMIIGFTAHLTTSIFLLIRFPQVLTFAVYLSILLYIIVICMLVCRVVSEPLHGFKLSRLVIKSEGKQLEIYFETTKNCFGLKNWKLKLHPLLISFDQIAQIKRKRWHFIVHSMMSGIKYDEGALIITNVSKSICRQ